VANRVFPKTRSWFALGAPLELLSPLSVLRIILAMATIVWPLLALPFGPTARTRWILLAVSVVFGVGWLRLMTVKGLSLRLSLLYTALGVIQIAIVVLGSHQPAIAAEYLLLSVVWCVFAALFFSVRQLALLLLSLGLLTWLGVAQTHGLARSAGGAVIATLALSSASVAITVTSRAARHRSTVDADTGLPNGFGLQQRMATRLPSTPYVVGVVCLAGLPEVREALGYQAGSELLRRAVEDLGQVLPTGALIGRVEGDELVVIQPIGSARSGAGADIDLDGGHLAGLDLARVVLGAFALGRYLLGGVETSLGARIGLAIAPWDGTAVADVIRRATFAARRAVSSGEAHRNWDGNSDALTGEDLALLADLRLAPARGELRLVYQPQIAAETGQAVAVEALIRWDHPTLGAISPGRFVPLAERTGLIDRITDFALSEALDAQVRWRGRGITLPVSVNLSAKVLSRPDLADRVVHELESRRLPAGALTLEITETAAAAVDVVGLVALLEPLRDRGVRISIDDFGTGYTSLSVLPDLPLDELKVDLGFVIRSAASPRDDAIVRSVADLARRLGLCVVAEGVENEECARRMTSYGFDLLQGYHFAPPLDEVQLEAYLGRARPLDPNPAPVPN